MSRLAAALLILLSVLPLFSRAAGDDLRPLVDWVVRDGDTYQPTTHRRFILPAPLASALGMGNAEVPIRQKAVVDAQDREIVNVLQLSETTPRDIVVSRRERLGGRWIFWRVSPDGRVLATMLYQPDGTVAAPSDGFEENYKAALAALRGAYAGTARPAR